MSGVCVRCDRALQIKARGLCGGCYTAVRRRARLEDYPYVKRSRAEVVEEVEHTAGTRGVEDIAAALGMSVQAVARTLYRAARPDLARPFSAAHQRERPARTRHRTTPAPVHLP